MNLKHFPGDLLCYFLFRPVTIIMHFLLVLRHHFIFVSRLLIQWHDSRFGCERSRVRIPDRPLLPMIVYKLLLKVQERISRKTTPKISYPITFLSACFKSPSINSIFNSDDEYLYKCSELFLGTHRYQFSKFLKNISQSSDFVLRYFHRIEYSYRFLPSPQKIKLIECALRQLLEKFNWWSEFEENNDNYTFFDTISKWPLFSSSILEQVN